MTAPLDRDDIQRRPLSWLAGSWKDYVNQSSTVRRADPILCPRIIRLCDVVVAHK